MKRSAKRLWIPVVMVIVGLIFTGIGMTSLITGVVNTTFKPEIVDANFQTETFQLSALDTNFIIKTNNINNVRITFDDSKPYGGEAIGDLSEFKVTESSNTTTIQTTRDICAITFSGCFKSNFDQITLNLPESYTGSITVNGLAQNVSVHSQSLTTLRSLDINTLNTRVELQNIDAKTELNAMNLDVSLSNVSGRTEVNSINSKNEIRELQRPLFMDVNGMNSTATISDPTGELGYHVSFESLAASFSDKQAGIERDRFFSSGQPIIKNTSNNLLTLELDGLNQSIVVR